MTLDGTGPRLERGRARDEVVKRGPCDRKNDKEFGRFEQGWSLGKAKGKEDGPLEKEV